MINRRKSAVWSTTKPIAPFSCTRRVKEVRTKPEVLHLTTKQIGPFSCTPRVQEVHTKAEVVHLTPGLLGLGVLFNCHA